MALCIVSILLIIALIKWWAYFVSTTALLRYMSLKGMRCPSNDEIKLHKQWVVTNWVNDIFKTNV